MGGSMAGGNANACAFVEVGTPGMAYDCYGVGLDGNIVTASVRALLSGANRLGAVARSEFPLRAAG